MKICYLADAGSIHTQRWIKYFADNGHEIHLISFRSLGDCNVKGVKLHLLKRLRPQIRFVSFPINLFFEVIQVKKLIKKINPDLLHAHYVVGYGVLGALAGFHPFLLTAWGSDVLISPKRSKISKWMVKYALKTADLITCDAEHIKWPLVELGAESHKINLIYFGVDTNKFKPGQRNKKINEELEIFDSPVVISLRSLEPLYNIESLIASIPLVLEKIPETKFIIAGKGSQEQKLKELAKLMGVLDVIRFVGQIPNNELAKYLTSSDVYVSTSLSDAGLAASTAEAMACGLPVVITDFGDNRKWIEDGVNGFVVPLKDPKALAEKIIYLLKHEDIRKKFGMRNRRIIEERNNYYKEMEKMEKIYIELVERYKS